MCVCFAAGKPKKVCVFSGNPLEVLMFHFAIPKRLQGQKTFIFRNNGQQNKQNRIIP